MKSCSDVRSWLGAQPAVFLIIVMATAAAQTPPPPAGATSQPSREAKQARRTPAEAKWVLPPIESPLVHYATFASRTAGENVSYQIYLPPGYENSSETRFPVVYWLHGIGGSQQGLPRFCERLTTAIGEGKAPAMIVVFVNGMVDSFYCDAINLPRPVESVIIKDLIPHIDATYRTIVTRAGRMIEGFSMGGFGAARLGAKYPDTFGSISIIDGALLGLAELKQRHQAHFERIFAGVDENFSAASPAVLTEKNADAFRGRTSIRLAVGMLVAPNANYHALLDRLKIDHDYQTFPGAGHNHAAIYDQMGDRNWQFYRQAFAAARTDLPSRARN